MSTPTPTATEMAAPSGSPPPSQPPADYERGTLRGWPRTVIRWLLLQAMRPFLDLTIIGLENVPPRGPFLFVANHLHNADPILLEIALKRPVHFMAKKELFRNRILGWLIRRFGTFPVDRGRPDRAAIRHAEALLAHGVAVGMFPEGTRSTTGALQRAFPGAGLIAVRTQVPIVPAAITGTEQLSWRRPRVQDGQDDANGRVRRPRVTIRFGEPVTLEPPDNDSRLGAAAATELMMQEIVKLLPAQYRGVYGSETAASESTARVADLADQEAV
jgi:1-acyl-sn-glycerol-3-phosphate acyltransferase